MKNAVVLVLAIVIFVSFANTAVAVTKATLFKDFVYSESMQSVQGKIKVSTCGKTPEGYELLCAEDYRFLDNDWTIKFVFEGKRLGMIVLDGDFTPEKLVKVIAIISKTFVLAAVQGNGTIFDYMEKSRTKGKDEAARLLNQFESDTAQRGFVQYNFFDDDSVKGLGGKVSTASDVLKMATETLREIDIDVMKTGDSVRMLMKFTAPLAAMKDIERESSANKEKF